MTERINHQPPPQSALGHLWQGLIGVLNLHDPDGLRGQRIDTTAIQECLWERIVSVSRGDPIKGLNQNDQPIPSFSLPEAEIDD